MQPRKSRCNHPRILVVDDNPVLRQVLKRILTSDGYTCVEAEDGQQAIEVLEVNKDNIDAVLLDLIMPRMDGYDSCLVSTFDV